jgi:cobaltochelatase CobT
MQKTLINALPIVAAAYGEKFGVNVIIQGNSAYTNGDDIVIPAADPMAPDYRSLVWGYLAHEAAHIRHTDFEVVKESASFPIRKAILNIIEDVRIEKALGTDYPGTFQTLHSLVKILIRDGKLSYPDNGDVAPALVFQSWLLFKLRSGVLKQDVLLPELVLAEADLRKLFPQPMIVSLETLCLQVSALSTTSEALALTDQFLELLRVYTPEKSFCDNKDSDNSEQPASPGEAENASEASATNAQPPGDSQQPERSKVQDADNSAQQSATNILSATDDDLLPDLQQLGSLALNAQAQEDNTKIKPFTLPIAEPAQPGGHNLLAKVERESSRIRARLQGLVQSSQERRNRYKHTGRHIALSRLAESQTGNTRVFSHQGRRTAPNTAIYLLIDASGSMCRRGDKDIPIQQTANEAALALALALEGIPGVRCGASYFPGYYSDVETALPLGQSVRNNAVLFDQKPRGTTPMAEALWYVANQLIYRQEERKIIIVITDGDPDDLEQTREIISLCYRGSIELVGVGIHTSSVEQLFRRCVVVNNLASLREALFELGEAAIG